MKINIKDIDDYISLYPKEVQQILKKIRTVIRKSAPQAEEVISYGMPAYKFQGMLIYFAAHTHHIGLYPMASGIAKFKKELSAYKGARGSVQFPYDKSIPYDLISEIVKFRVQENLEKAETKSKKKI